jgi:quercetin dioxygenase-like cupin family protein
MRPWILSGLACVALFGGTVRAKIIQARTVTTAPAPTPLILEKDEGELRERRPREASMASNQFFIKVDRKNGGSQQMFMGAEDIPPGGLIPKHKHLGQDEILIIQSGSAHAWLGTQERDVHAGAVIFIPSDTWVSLKNTGSEIIRLAFVFSAPGYDEFMRCTSVPAGDSVVNRVSKEEFVECEHKGHVQYGDNPGSPAPR